MKLKELVPLPELLKYFEPEPKSEFEKKYN